MLALGNSGTGKTHIALAIGLAACQKSYGVRFTTAASWWLKSKGGVRQWKNCWAVLRPRNLILYRDESEYAVQFLIELPAIIDVVDIDSISRTKAHCLQVITEEKSYRFAARDEETLLQCLGAFKSLLAKRRELEAKAAAAAAAAAAVTTSSTTTTASS